MFRQTLTCTAITLSTILTAAPPAQASTRTVQINITDRGFVPSQVVAVINQPITLRITNQGRKVHEFGLPYYRIFTPDIMPGQTSTVSFSPWTAGRFDMVSEPAEVNAPQFSGKFIVTDHK